MQPGRLYRSEQLIGTTGGVNHPARATGLKQVNDIVPAASPDRPATEQPHAWKDCTFRTLVFLFLSGGFIVHATHLRAAVGHAA